MAHRAVQAPKIAAALWPVGALELRLHFPGGPRAARPVFEFARPGSSPLLRFDCSVDHGALELGVAASADREPRILADPAFDSIDWALDECDHRLAEHLKATGFEGDIETALRGWARVREEFVPALRNPPTDFAALDRGRLAQRVSEKWNTYPKAITPAWVAEMDFPLAHPVRRVLAHTLALDDVGYPLSPRESGVAEAFAERMQRFDWEIDPRRVELLAEVVQAQHVTLEAFSARGDGVVVQPPIYPPFLSSVRNMGRRLVLNPLVQEADGFQLDFAGLAGSADAETRMFLLCNPHNPSGRVFTRDELEALAKLARERDWIVVSDEIHADLLFDGRRHIPFASLSDEAAARTVTLTSATKAFNIPGLRCCVTHFGSAALQQRFNQAVPRALRGGMNLLGMAATVAAWRHADPWLDGVRAQLERNRDQVCSFVAKHCPGIRTSAPDSTYLAWLDCRDLGLEPSPARFFYEHAGVALSDGAAFGRGYEGYARLNFATSPALLGDVLERLARALRER